ncbi:hypothetical protein BKA67DRAFT_533704 [Truncatella angustata]|uniref:Alcohol acetyltransferase n=1 Tax=Truncatella angustata TaxID=152316 RepID=A0A9P8UU52_9PEZI|nr:uncharacterized protein BKA67DRAFT_533704 [Truncatella angustata]KAH6658557.1 hypothetical protein BKA67DRAFT_533704 [Truncatella angustata]
MRLASPNEQRAISREYCGFYNAVVIGAVYEFSGSDVDVCSSVSFYGATKRCIDNHPTLSVVVRDMHTDAAFFERVPTVNLEDHISIVGESDTCALAPEEGGGGGGDEMVKIERLLPSILDRPWPGLPPPWRIVVLPLLPSKQLGREQTRCFVAFSFSHALGDGIIGHAFHSTFRAGIFDQVEADCSALPTPVADFPAPFDTAKNLPISWGFLLRPLLAVLLPKFVADLTGLRATTSAIDHGTWTGASMFFEPESFRSRPLLIELQAAEVANVLRVSRNNGARFTATMHQSIVRALSRALPPGDAANFVSGTAVNMRRAVGKSNDEMGFFVNACYEFHDRDEACESAWSEKAWEPARSLTKKLAECAVTLKDQPLGLLRYVPSISKWTAAKIGKERDSSYDLSNLGAFEATVPEDPETGGQCNITKMIFSRPVNATSAPITLSVASVKSSSMVIAVVWQPGALGVPLESESTFIDGLCTFLKEDLKNLR